MLYKILIADDEPQTIKNLYYALEKENFDIYSASNGKQAIQIAIEKQPHTIILDWNMPEINGIKATKYLRKHPNTQNIPIVIATGSMLNINGMKEAFKAGVNEFIYKPINEIELVSRIYSMIRYYTSFKKSIRLEKELSEKKIDLIKSELNITLLKTAQRGKIINLIKNEFDNIEIHCNPEGKRIIQRLKNELLLNKSIINWQEIEIKMKNIHDDFYQKLLSKHSNLTKNEINLCIFIRLNLDNKSILALTLSTEDALKKSKYRLKQKLGLSNDQHLSSYLIEL